MKLAAIDEDVARLLDPTPPLTSATLVGVAGTVTTIAAIARAVDPYDATKIHGAELSRAEGEDTAARLPQLPLEERVRLPGLSPKRADVIVAGAALCAAIMRRASAERLVVRSRGALGSRRGPGSRPRRGRLTFYDALGTVRALGAKYLPCAGVHLVGVLCRRPGESSVGS